MTNDWEIWKQVRSFVTLKYVLKSKTTWRSRRCCCRQHQVINSNEEFGNNASSIVITCCWYDYYPYSIITLISRAVPKPGPGIGQKIIFQYPARYNNILPATAVNYFLTQLQYPKTDIIGDYTLIILNIIAQYHYL